MSIRYLLAWMTLGAAIAATTQAVAADSVTFGKPIAQVGDTVRQSVNVDLKLETVLRQEAEVVEESTRQVTRLQSRTVTATALDGDRVIAAEVTFDASHAESDGQRETDPVVGKRYLCWREGDELRVTTPDESTPPMKEFAVVVRAMQTLGTPSPLAEHLAGRTVQIGELTKLPNSVAQQSLGFDKEMGQVVAFELTLKAIEASPAGEPLARFDAHIEAVGGGSQQMRLFVAGAFTLDVENCRIVSADVSGPLAMSALRGPASQGYQLDAKGKLHLRVASTYKARQ